MDIFERKRHTAQLGGLYDAAQLLPHPYAGLIPNDIAWALAYDNLTDEQAQWLAEASKDQRRLARALFDPVKRSSIRCAKASERARRGGQSEELCAVHDGELVVAQVTRPPPLSSGWRPYRHLLIDLPLLGREVYDGITIDECGSCGGTHLLARRWLKKAGPVEISKPSTETDDGYTSVELGAFAEMWGPADEASLAEDRPDIYLFLTPSRAEIYREHFANRPDVLSHLWLLVDHKLRITGPGNEGKLISSPWTDDPTTPIGEWPLPDANDV